MKPIRKKKSAGKPRIRQLVLPFDTLTHANFANYYPAIKNEVQRAVHSNPALQKIEDDIAQEIAIRVLRHVRANTYDPTRATPDAFIRVVTQSSIRDFLRKIDSRKPAEHARNLHDHFKMLRAENRFRTIQLRRRSRILRLARRLPPIEARAVRLFIGGHSFEEVGAFIREKGALRIRKSTETPELRQDANYVLGKRTMIRLLTKLLGEPGSGQKT